jgi:hypothetical protein
MEILLMRPDELMRSLRNGDIASLGVAATIALALNMADQNGNHQAEAGR